MIDLDIQILNEQNNEAICRAVEVLSNDGVIIYPTDTVYGIGANATKEKTVKKVFNVKNRIREKPISILVSNKEMIKDYAVINDLIEDLIDNFLPGPITLLVPKKNLPNNLTAGKKKVGIRMIENQINKVINKFGKPITSTSANISGKNSSKYFERAIKGLKFDLALDGGDCHGGIPSTVFDPLNWEIIREGPIKLEEIERKIEVERYDLK